MSIVRRPHSQSKGFAYLLNRPIPPGTDPGSRQTLLKAESMKRFLEEHYFKLMKETKERQRRYRKIRRKIERSDKTPEQKQNIFFAFIQEESKYLRIMRTRFKAERFERIKLIGRGGYGEVWLVCEKVTGDIFALKVLRKADIIIGDQVKNVRSERDLLTISKNPWIVKLHYSFQDAKYVYLVMEFVAGGDLMSMLIKRGSFNMNLAKFYIGETILALRSVHDLGYIHRDMKPDNILITTTGHIKLTDFGLATNYKKPNIPLQQLLEEIQDTIMGKNNEDNVNIPTSTRPAHRRNDELTICTVDYTAPEIFMREPPTTLTDSWSIGVMMFEMIYGYNPFIGQDDTSIQQVILRIVYWQRALKYPNNKFVSSEALDLMRHLLCGKQDRYDIPQMMAHPFFRGFNFEDPFSNKPDYIPVIQSATDTTHFDVIQPNENETGGIVPASELMQFAFLGFTYKERPQSHALMALGNADFDEVSEASVSYKTS